MDIQGVRKQTERFLPLIIFLSSGAYYYALSSKIFTWVYTSGDAGDWLSLLHWWYVPHCWGKPLIVLYIRFLGLFPGDDIIKLTVGMAIIPAAITVTFTYLIVKRLTSKITLGIVAALILLGAVIFTTQATVVEQYTFSAMFLAIALYWHTRNNKPLTLAFLGLFAATHVIGFALTFIWLAVYWREWRTWLRLSPLFIITGVLPYSLILALMANPSTPKLVAGGLSWQSINVYLGNTTSTAALAIVAVPDRLGQFASIAVITLGLSLIPLVKGVRPLNNLAKLIIASIGFVLWFYLTTLFPSVWKWLTFILPMVAILVAFGLNKLPRWHTWVIATCSVGLIITNGFLMNTNCLAHEDPQATEYIAAIEELPNNSCIVVPRGGQYGFTVFYLVSSGKPIIPIAQCSPFAGTSTPTAGVLEKSEAIDQSYIDHLAWLERVYGIVGNSMYEVVQYALDNGYNVYYGQPITEIWNEVFVLDNKDSEKEYLQKIVAVNHNPDLSKWE